MHTKKEGNDVGRQVVALGALLHRFARALLACRFQVHERRVLPPAREKLRLERGNEKKKLKSFFKI
jgi:hypothetical protein